MFLYLSKKILKEPYANKVVYNFSKNLLPICVSVAGLLRPNFFALEQSPKPTPAKLALEPSSTFEMVVATDIPAVA